MKLQYSTLKTLLHGISRDDLQQASKLTDDEILTMFPSFTAFDYDGFIEFVNKGTGTRFSKVEVVKDLKMCQYIGQRQYDIRTKRHVEVLTSYEKEVTAWSETEDFKEFYIKQSDFQKEQTNATLQRITHHGTEQEDQRPDKVDVWINHKFATHCLGNS